VSKLLKVNITTDFSSTVRVITDDGDELQLEFRGSGSDPSSLTTELRLPRKEKNLKLEWKLNLQNGGSIKPNEDVVAKWNDKVIPLKLRENRLIDPNTQKIFQIDDNDFRDFFVRLEKEGADRLVGALSVIRGDYVGCLGDYASAGGGVGAAIGGVVGSVAGSGVPGAGTLAGAIAGSGLGGAVGGALGGIWGAGYCLPKVLSA
jgi:hypothetical protein